MQKPQTETESFPEEFNPKKGKRLAIIVLAMLFVPVLIWGVMILFSETRCKPLMIVKTTNAAGDSIEHKLPAFIARTQSGKPFTHDSLQGTIHVADFFFTTCPGICKDLSQQMAELQKKLIEKNVTGIRLVSYSVDPKTDSVAALKAYADRYQAVENRWVFLTGEEDALINTITKGYLQPAYKSPDGKEKVTHSNMFVLVDKALRIRGFYRAIPNQTGPAEIKRLLEEIDVLRCEYRTQEKR